MTAFVLTDANLYFGGRDISGLVNQAALEITRNLPEDSVMGDTTVSRLAGTRDSQVSINGFWDVNLDSEMFTEHELAASSGEVFSITTEALAENVVGYSMEAQLASYVLGAAHGEVYPFTMELQSANPLLRGKVFVSGLTSSDPDSSAIQLGAVAANERVWSALHVIALGGGGPLVDVIVESDSSPSFSSPTTRLTHTQFSAVGAEFINVAGAITDTWWRVGVNNSSGDTATILCIVGIVTAG